VPRRSHKSQSCNLKTSENGEDLLGLQPPRLSCGSEWWLDGRCEQMVFTGPFGCGAAECPDIWAVERGPFGKKS